MSDTGDISKSDKAKWNALERLSGWGESEVQAWILNQVRKSRDS